MTPDWLVKLGIEKINTKEHGPDVSWLIEELSARLDLPSTTIESYPHKVYKIENDKTTAREITRENTLDDSGDFNQT